VRQRDVEAGGHYANLEDVLAAVDETAASVRKEAGAVHGFRSQEVAPLVRLEQVARAQPAIGQERLARLLLIPPIAQRNMAPAHEQLAGLADARVRAVSAQYLRLRRWP
jgi:hypothetical protein